ncbi:UDP-glucose:glycoprotein glucosyltransferase [Podosphaera aphanis]|nr:UDP-glucose:glycoprotein glucosyltransferase [Podosphaera aphanis]
MRASWILLPWDLTGNLLILLLSSLVYSSPLINVELKTAFPSPPYLLELLETAAAENATSYFPLLDRIADGYFSNAETDKELYERFLQVLKDDGHLLDLESLSLYKLALSMRSSAPRIEAHYQYYDTAAEPSLISGLDAPCSAWTLYEGKQYCSSSLEKAQGKIYPSFNTQELQFDRVLGNRSASASILYIDPTSPVFGEYHKKLAQNAREGKSSYRLRYKRPSSRNSTPFTIPGWGVELALKKTDYIVIDDRDNNEPVVSVPASEIEAVLDEDELDDLKPLSTSEVSSLAIKASSFIMQSESPLDTLVKLTQDFPKYSSALVSHNSTDDFIEEHSYNRAQLISDGRNVMWMNGLQLVDRQVEILDLVDMIRKERRLINSVRDLGLSAPDVIRLLSHPKIATAKLVSEEVQRFDWRDNIEGGNVIIWMNDLEKDQRYARWPTSLTAVLQRSYPGQIPSIRRDIFNVVTPINLTNPEDVRLAVETLLSFVKQRIPIRVGLVPISGSAQATDQAKVVYYLLDTYGLQAVIAYLQKSSESKTTNTPSSLCFEHATQGREIRKGKASLAFDEVLRTDKLDGRVKASKEWLNRLAASNTAPPFFVNGVVVQKDDNWLQKLSQQVNTDLQSLQQAIVQNKLDIHDKDLWVPSIYLVNALNRRNSLIFPEDQRDLKIFDLNTLYKKHHNLFNSWPRVLADSSSKKSEWIHMILILDLESELGEKLFATATTLRSMKPSIELLIAHNSNFKPGSGISDDLFDYVKKRDFKASESINDLTDLLTREINTNSETSSEESKNYWKSSESFAESLSLLPGQNAILINGRLVGPIPDSVIFDIEDMEILLSSERKERIVPAYDALADLGLTDKIPDLFSAAKISSIVALSTISETTDGIQEKSSVLRMSQFDIWKSSRTAIDVGDAETSSIQLVIVLNPASNQGQRWVAILKILSELEGVSLKIYLNPNDRLTELPVKRFYRYVLASTPTFSKDGTIKSQDASFTGIPKKALLTAGLDIPPAWLVAPKVSKYDLDNIKLSSINTDVKVTYELEHILIEGHSREVPRGEAPRGAQLVLGTERDPHISDTIIMSNLGYFQFKANPGFFHIKLLEGRSSEIFHIDSVGAEGWSPVPGDEKNDVILMSFKGIILYPRLSRNPGMEKLDVLEVKDNSKMDFVSQGLKFAQEFISKRVVTHDKQAHINIFSVASGHLYERMLKIMIVSVMKHTNHSVKFWFIEQFLSPSFKNSIPHLASHYDFKYEMITYKWPSWLRAQTEKQRVIWGYKILFLDVLFPLSLDKVIFVDADQIVRTDLFELVQLDLKGAPYGFTPMCDSRTEMEGFRFWKQGYWAKFLRGLPYHISALYVVDLRRFRQIAAGDRLRQQYHALSADPGSLANLDQDLPNHMQSVLPIYSLPQEWLWCETWCSDQALENAKTIDLCNNPLTKEPKLDRARRQIPEWTLYDGEIASLEGRKVKSEEKNIKSRNFEEPIPITASRKDEL